MYIIDIYWLANIWRLCKRFQYKSTISIQNMICTSKPVFYVYNCVCFGVKYTSFTSCWQITTVYFKLLSKYRHLPRSDNHLVAKVLFMRRIWKISAYSSGIWRKLWYVIDLWIYVIQSRLTTWKGRMKCGKYFDSADPVYWGHTFAKCNAHISVIAGQKPSYKWSKNH